MFVVMHCVYEFKYFRTFLLLHCIDMDEPVIRKKDYFSSTTHLQNITLSCLVLSHPTPQVTWNLKTGRYNTVVGNTTNLTLYNVDESKSGEYICNVKVGIIERSARYQLTVRRKLTYQLSRLPQVMEHFNLSFALFALFAYFYWNFIKRFLLLLATLTLHQSDGHLPDRESRTVLEVSGFL